MTYSPSLALKSRYCVVASETPGWFILCDRETTRPVFARHTEEECWEDARISDKIYKSLIGYANSEEIPVPKLSDLRLPSPQADLDVESRNPSPDAEPQESWNTSRREHHRKEK